MDIESCDAGDLDCDEVNGDGESSLLFIDICFAGLDVQDFLIASFYVTDIRISFRK